MSLKEVNPIWKLYKKSVIELMVFKIFTYASHIGTEFSPACVYHNIWYADIVQFTTQMKVQIQEPTSNILFLHQT